MNIFSENFKIVYIDLDITQAGNGSTPDQALNDLPLPTDMKDNTIYLCRRTNNYSILSEDSTATELNNVYILGMPRENDALYKDIPQEAKDKWDKDEHETFRLYLNQFDRKWSFFNINNLGFHRISFERNNNENIADVTSLNFIGNHNLSITNCIFKEWNNNSFDKLKMYIRGWERVRFENNNVQHIGDSSLTDISSLDFSNNIISVHSTTKEKSIFKIFTGTLTLINNKIKFIDRDSEEMFFPSLFNISCGRLKINNFEAKSLSEKSHKNVLMGAILNIKTNKNIEIKNIDLQLQHINGISKDSLMSIEGNGYDNVIEDITINLPNGQKQEGFPLVINSCQGKIKSINVYNENGKGMKIGSCRLATNVICHGTLLVGNTGFIEIDEFKSNLVGEKLIESKDSSIYIHNVDLKIVTEKWMKLYRSKVVIKNINLPIRSEYTESSVWGINVEGVKGNWYASNGYFKGETLNVKRTNGTSSIKLSCEQENNSKPLELLLDMFNGMEWTTEGKNVLKVHVALKSFKDSSLLSNNLEVILETPDRIYNSVFDGKWIHDDSEWIGDNNLMARVLEMPFEVFTKTTIKVLMKYHWNGDGYLYLDPQIVFE